MVIFWWLRRAWFWVTGLRLRTRAWQDRQDEALEFAERSAHLLARHLAKAEADKRQAQRLVALLSEPLKDWDLADFPDWAERPPIAGSLGPLRPEDANHLRHVVQRYRMLSVDLAQARMTATTNDSTRRRGWLDQPLPPAVAIHRNRKLP